MAIILDDQQWLGISYCGLILMRADPEILLSVISNVYDCALDVSLWPQTLNHLAGVLDAAYTAVALVTPLQRHPGGIVAHSQWDIERIRQLSEYREEVPGFIETVMGDIDTPYIVSQHLTLDDLRNMRVYREWALPQGLGDGATMKFAQTADLRGIFGMGLYASRGPMCDDEVTFICLLSPHLRRAALISDLLEQSLVAATAYRAALDKLTTPVLLTDGKGQLKHANAAADTLLREERGLLLSGGIVTAASQLARPALADAVARAAADGGELLGARGIGIPLSSAGERPIIAYVLPLARSELRSSFGSSTVAIFASLAASHVPPREALLVALFDLTRAEARVMYLSAAGSSLADIGAALGVTENTVKTHLGRVYSKTGVSRQVEIVALMSSITMR